MARRKFKIQYSKPMTARGRALIQAGQPLDEYIAEQDRAISEKFCREIEAGRAPILGNTRT